jgi:hypothetical protein
MITMARPCEMKSFLQWSAEEANNFGIQPQKTRHTVHQLDYFSDEALLQLLESYTGCGFSPPAWIRLGARRSGSR